MHPKLSTFLHGVLAGAAGASCMTVLRMLAHRAGWIDAMVPQAVEIWAKDSAGLARPRALAAHHLLDQALHLGYGAALGGSYALVKGERADARRALGLGVGLWAFASGALFPLLKIARPLWRAEPREELVNLGAHALYGAVTVYLLEEFSRQELTQPRGNGRMRRARVG